MPTLTRAYRWERFTPHIGENRSLPDGERFELEFASGVSPARLDEYSAAMAEVVKIKTPEGATAEEVAAVTERYLDQHAAALEGLVRLVTPVTINGVVITTVREYLAFLHHQVGGAGTYNVQEIQATVLEWNTVQGQQRLFYERRFGGATSTQSAARKPPTAH